MKAEKIDGVQKDTRTNIVESKERLGTAPPFVGPTALPKFKPREN